MDMVRFLCNNFRSFFVFLLEEIADQQDMSLGKFLSLMYDEVLEMTTDEEKMTSNFTSLLRCACLTYVS